MSTQTLAERVVAKVAEDYRRRGYDVAIRPRGAEIPEFLSDYQPELIARSAADSVVVDVKVGTRTSVAERFREIAERVNQQSGWRFSLVFVNPDQPDQISEAPLAPLPELQERVKNADTLLQSGQSEAAFLLLWSALEGIMRVLAHRAQLPLENLPPSTLIRELYSAGEISHEQFDKLLSLLPLRNRLVHGFGDTREHLDVEQLRSTVHALLQDVARA